jgi:hypothetical protein
VTSRIPNCRKIITASGSNDFGGSGDCQLSPKRLLEETTLLFSLF